MSSNVDIVEFIVGQIKEAGNVRLSKMFGKYALYVDEKVVAQLKQSKPPEVARVFHPWGGILFG